MERGGEVGEGRRRKGGGWRTEVNGDVVELRGLEGGAEGDNMDGEEKVQ